MEGKSAGRGFLILSIAGILGKLLSAIYVPLLTAILGKEGYGIYGAGYDIFIFLIAITTFGIQPAVTKVVTELRALGNYKDGLHAMKLSMRYIGIISVIISALFMALSYPIAKLIKAESSALTFMFLAPALIFAAILAVFRGYMQGIEDMETLAVSQVIEQLVNVILSLVFASLLLGITGNLSWGSAGGTVGTSLGAIVALVYIIYIYYKKDYYGEAEIKHDLRKKQISSKKILKKVMVYAIPITLVAAVQNFAGVIDTVTLGISLDMAGFSGDIIYNLRATLSYYKTLIYVPLAIVTALGTSIFPKIIQAFVHKDRKELKYQTSYSFRIMYIIVMPATFGLAILSKEIYKFLLNDSEGYLLLMYGSTLLIFMSITTIQNVILQGINKTYLIIYSVGFGLLAKILLNLLLVSIPSINIMGAVVATFVSYIIPTVINHKKIKEYFKLNIPIVKQAIIPGVCSIIMSTIILLIKPLVVNIFMSLGEGRIVSLIICAILMIVGGIVYLYAMILFGGIRKADLDLISPKLFRYLPRLLRKELM